MFESLHRFFSGFGLPAYPAENVPDGAALPYLTYERKGGRFGDGPLSLTATLWFRSDSQLEADRAADRIAGALGPGGAVLPCQGGCLWLQRGTPWCLCPTDPGHRDLRVRVLNFWCEYLVR